MEEWFRYQFSGYCKILNQQHENVITSTHGFHCALCRSFHCLFKTINADAMQYCEFCSNIRCTFFIFLLKIPWRYTRQYKWCSSSSLLNKSRARCNRYFIRCFWKIFKCNWKLPHLEFPLKVLSLCLFPSISLVIEYQFQVYSNKQF